MAVGNATEPKIPLNINRVVLKEAELIGSVSCTREEFSETIDLIAKGMIDAEKYITDVMPLEDLQEAFQRLTSKTNPALIIVVQPT